MLWWLGEGAAWAGLEPWSARVAVLTNLAPNHVDWHGTVGHYMRSKAEIRRHQRAGDAFVTLFDEDAPLTPLELVQPEIYVKGGDYDMSTIPEARHAARWNAKVMAIAFEHQRSTTALLRRVRQD